MINLTFTCESVYLQSVVTLMMKNNPEEKAIGAYFWVRYYQPTLQTYTNW